MYRNELEVAEGRPSPQKKTKIVGVKEEAVTKGKVTVYEDH